MLILYKTFSFHEFIRIPFILKNYDIQRYLDDQEILNFSIVNSIDE